ncbi:hypothetical protein BDQ12DRAFT_635008 [Crucibulum laeve]|uniref:DUF6535 domain-containing protein n=1 Tax=Crucibulum laeve TaxID=68775 RepID=A0A5C3LSI6_9AGAR|nr:hypothetical protein BDQ12DRAFT_635008 [Crucibulum laeve]
MDEKRRSNPTITIPAPVRSGNKPWSSEDPYQHPLPKPTEDPWETCHILAKKYDKEMCSAWKDEVDKLLIFAGLFSATVTSFGVESYKMLQDDPTETSAQLLSEVVWQLNRINDSSNVSSSSTPTVPSLAVSPMAVRVNICWFLSLALSLTTVLIGILCLQWLREYQREGSLISKDAFSLREMRYHGLSVWKVPTILAALPLLLQTALVLFFAGLLDLLWFLDWKVALPITVAVGATCLFLLATTILPSLQCFYAENSSFALAQCPYKSPQSWAFHHIACALYSTFSTINYNIGRIIWGSRKKFSFLDLPAGKDWYDFDMFWRDKRDTSLEDVDSGLGLLWVALTRVQNLVAIYCITHCLQDVTSLVASKTIRSLDHSLRLPDDVGNSDSQIDQDFRSAYVLAYFVKLNGRIRQPLTPHRFELFVRLMHSGRKNIDAVRSIFPADSLKFIDDLPSSSKIQLLGCLRISLARDQAIEGDWILARLVVSAMLECDCWRSDHFLGQTLQSFNITLQLLIRQSPDNIQERRMKYCVRFITDLYNCTLSGIPQEKRFHGFETTLASLINYLQGSMSDMDTITYGTKASQNRTKFHWDLVVANLVPKYIPRQHHLQPNRISAPQAVPQTPTTYSEVAHQPTSRDEHAGGLWYDGSSLVRSSRRFGGSQLDLHKAWVVDEGRARRSTIVWSADSLAHVQEEDSVFEEEDTTEEVLEQEQEQEQEQKNETDQSIMETSIPVNNPASHGKDEGIGLPSPPKPRITIPEDVDLTEEPEPISYEFPEETVDMDGLEVDFFMSNTDISAGQDECTDIP